MFDRYIFGSYPHDGERENISWLVLERNGNEAKLISEYVLDANSFSRSGENVWEDSSLREWLQEDFLNKAFTEEQQEALVEAMCECEQREGQEVVDTDYSFDKVTLLSLDEVREYFPTDDDRIAKATQYAQDEGVEIEYAADCCGWWLRSPGVKTMGLSSWNACVMANGTVKPWGVYTGSIGVRPVITVNLDLASSCQYDMVEDDEDGADPVATLEKLQELLDQLKALRGEDDDNDDDLDSYDDEDFNDESAEEDDSDKPVVLRTITDVLQVNEVVSVRIPEGLVCEETLGEDGDTAIHIKGGMYTDNNDNVCWKLNTGIVEIQTDPDEHGKLYDGMELIEYSIANSGSEQYIKIDGVAQAAFAVKKTPLNIAGRIIKLYGLLLIIPWSTGKIVLLSHVCNITNGTEDLRESYQLFLDVARSVGVNGQPLTLGKVSVEDMLRELVPSFEDDEEGAINLKIGFEVNGTDAGSITYNADGSVTNETPEELPEAEPQGYLYAHYRKVQPPSFSLPNTTWIVNANGTEFDPLSIEKHLADEDAQALLSIVQNYKRRDTYSLDETARELAEVFRVDMDVFNSRHDRLGEIYAGNLQKCYTFSALRSFAWTLGKMADNSGRNIDDYSIEELLRIIDFVADQRWLNYDTTGVFQALCDHPDLHVMYVPDQLCSDEYSAQLRTTLAQMPVTSLDDFRDCLEKLHPVMIKLAEHLKIDRNSKEQLTGNVADVLYAWCSLCIAAKEPFISEDGPMMCLWDYPGDAMGYLKAHGSPVMQRFLEQQEQYEQERTRKKAQWIETYSAYISKHPSVTIAGKKFVFTGLGVIKADQKEQPIVQRVIAQGGLFRQRISGVTDYLVVGDDDPGESKIKEAIAQQEAGKPLQIIRLADLENVLDGKTVSADYGDSVVEDEADQVTAADPEALNALQQNLSRFKQDLSDMQDALGHYGDIQRQQEEEKQRREKELEATRASAVIDADNDEACMYVALSIIDELGLTNKYGSSQEFFDCYGEDFPAYEQDALWNLRCKVNERRLNNEHKIAYERCFRRFDVPKKFLWTVSTIVNISPVFDVAARFEQGMQIASKWFAENETAAVQTELQKLKKMHRDGLQPQFAAICDDWLKWSTAKPLMYVEYRNAPSPYDENTMSEQIGNTVVTLRIRSSRSSFIVSQVLNWYAWYWDVSVDETWAAAYKNRFDANGHPLQDNYVSDETGDNDVSSMRLCKALDELGISYRQYNSATSSRTTASAPSPGTYERPRQAEVNSVSEKPKKEGCYIATAVYGSYDAPEVMVLRRFRDETLQKSTLGRWFIRTYYRWSPSVANKLRNAKGLNRIIRKILDSWVDNLNSRVR